MTAVLVASFVNLLLEPFNVQIAVQESVWHRCPGCDTMYLTWLPYTTQLTTPAVSVACCRGACIPSVSVERRWKLIESTQP